MNTRRVPITHTNININDLNDERAEVIAHKRLRFTYISVCAGCGNMMPAINARGRHDSNTCAGMILVEVDSTHVTCVCC